MQPTRFSVKYFVRGAVRFDIALLVPIFQRWIQQHSVEGLLIDVADYKHVKDGPGIALIGHEGDYSFDLRGGRPGLLYVRKRAHLGSFLDDLNNALQLASTAAQTLESESSLKRLRFNYDEVEIAFLDRLNTPNTPDVLDALRADLETTARGLFQSDAVVIESTQTDVRKVLTVRLTPTLEGVAG